MSNVTVLDTPCREWRGATKWTSSQVQERGGRGYGNVYRRGRYWSLHRWIWTLANGPIPDGERVLHHCDNPPCFRLDHLFLGSQADNMADKVAKGRASGGRHMAERTHCPKGHAYDEANTYHRPDKPHWRGCKACQLVSNQARRRRLQEKAD